jgi:subtilase family serine protease
MYENNYFVTFIEIKKALKVKGNYRRYLSYTSFDSELYSINVGSSTKNLKGGIRE